MFEKIERFGAKPKSLPLEVRSELIVRLEKGMGSGVLPDEYRNFLEYFGASVMFNSKLVFKGIEASPWANDNLYDDLESLYGLNEFGGEYSVFEAIETYNVDLKNQWIPIGSSSGGNQICLCVYGEMFGQVWFWDHESDPHFDLDNVISGMSFSAKNFTDFIDRLEVDKEDPDITGVVKVDLDF